MKNTTRLVTLIAGACAAFSFSALAEEEGKKDGARRGGPGRDGPGARRELTEEQKAERAKRREAMKAARDAADAAGNGNGKIDGEEEKAAFIAAVKIILFDADGNKVLEGEELEKAAKFKGFRGRGRRGRGPEGRERRERRERRKKPENNN